MWDCSQKVERFQLACLEHRMHKYGFHKSDHISVPQKQHWYPKKSRTPTPMSPIHAGLPLGSGLPKGTLSTIEKGPFPWMQSGNPAWLLRDAKSSRLDKSRRESRSNAFSLLASRACMILWKAKRAGKKVSALDPLGIKRGKTIYTIKKMEFHPRFCRLSPLVYSLSNNCTH